MEHTELKKLRLPHSTKTISANSNGLGVALAAVHDQCDDESNAIFADISTEIHATATRRAALEAMQARMQEHAATAATMVTLNVGGTLFATAKTNLLRDEGSYFYTMLASETWQPNADGAYFIDVDPRQFPHVMAYLRSGEWDITGLGALDCKQLFRLIDYLQLPSPFPVWDALFSSPHLNLSDDKRGVSVDTDATCPDDEKQPSPTISWDLSNCSDSLCCHNSFLMLPEGVAGTHAVLLSRAVVRFSIKVLAVAKGLEIGFAPRHDFAPVGNGSGVFFTWTRLPGETYVRTPRYEMSVEEYSSRDQVTITAESDVTNQHVHFMVRGTERADYMHSKVAPIETGMVPCVRFSMGFASVSLVSQ
ncbi:hypothetical protein ACHHYP_11693 [Achlya hypogyna]|uniref:BTB domain-containing protein n=1 Tax=Achlya hypogyna TaxID=1202772 RepID=A0A1V9YIM5_ACHHY|nr:hypothetical protein ACHHYP_11693 [Achlya hypogyna]